MQSKLMSVSGSRLEKEMVWFLRRVLNLSMIGAIKWNVKPQHYASSRGATTFIHYSTEVDGIAVTVIAHERTPERDPEIRISFKDSKKDHIFDVEKLSTRGIKFLGKRFLDRDARKIVMIYRELLNSATNRLAEN